MKLTEIKALTDAELLSAFYWIGVRTTKETNSRRGLTNKTAKEEEYIIFTVAKRFNIDHEELLKIMQFGGLT